MKSTISTPRLTADFIIKIVKEIFKAALKVLLIVIVIQCFNIDCYAKIKASNLPENFDIKYGKWINLPINELVKKGREFLYVKNCPDSALVCFSIAASRYNESLPADEKEEIYKAFTGKWYAQFFHYYDYPKAYESLLEANKISEELGKGRGISNFNLALMYQMFALDGRDKDVVKTSHTYLQKAFNDAIAENDTNVVHLAFSNIVSSMTDKTELENLAPHVKKYQRFNARSSNPMTGFNLLLYSINLAIANGNYREALALLDRQRDLISPDQPRYLISNLMSRAQIYRLQNDYVSAERMLEEAEKIAREGQMKDVLMNIYDSYYKLYEQQGNKDKRLDAYHAYLLMKDTLLNYRQISGFNQIKFLSEMEKMDDTLAQLEYKRKMQLWAILLCVAVCVGLLGFLLIILKKNRKLSAANMSLYQKTKELMDREENERLQEIEVTVKDNENKSQDTNPTLNQLPGERRDSVMKIIIEAAKTSQEIYSPKFTVAKLSEIIGLPAKQVSQVINESTGDNFNVFINRYRIKKACRMFDDVEKYGGYTIENIGLNVGFRSRTAFISSFKKVTGLTPSDYLKAAKQAKASKNHPEEKDRLIP